MVNYVPLILEGLAMLVALFLFVILNRFKFFKKIPDIIRQIIYGITFGLLAIIATQHGQNIGSAIVNVRDAAPLVAGLCLGGPAGAIAGLIGGVQRFLTSIVSGLGDYTKYACSISTIIAGFIAWALRAKMFERKSPSWGFGLAIGVVMECFHLLLIFVFHLKEPYEVLELVRILTLPMIIANGVVVMLACLGIQLIDFFVEKKNLRKRTINTKIQFWMLILVVSSALVSNVFLIIVENNFAAEQGSNILYKNIFDMESTVTNYSDKLGNGFLELANTELKNDSTLTAKELLDRVNSKLDVGSYLTQVNYVSIKGIVTDSSDPTNVGYNMYTTDQSRSFHSMMLFNDSYCQQFYNKYQEEDTYVKYCGKHFDNKLSDGYFQICFGQDTFYASDISIVIREASKYRRVNQNGFVIIYDYKNRLVTEGDPSMFAFDTDYLDTILPLMMHSGIVFKDDATPYYFMFSEVETYYVIVTFPMTDVTNMRDAVIYLFNYISIVIYALIFVLSHLLIDTIVVKRIHSINSSLGLIIAGDLDQKVEVNSTEEFEDLSNDINITVDTLKKYIAQEAQRLDSELAFAKKVQLSSLPSVFPPFPDHKSFDIYASMYTAKQVGGDFYDFYLLNYESLAFLVADVSGKGIPASMFMMESKAMLKNYAQSGEKLKDIFFKANNALSSGNEANMFVTCWMGILNIRTGVVKFVNAGHNIPVVYRKKTNTWEYLKQKKNMVLAGLEDMKYDEQELILEPGDRIYLYTDGVTEATRWDNTLYGEDRLLEYLSKHTKDKQKNVLDGIKGDIDTFVEEGEQFDDITMLIVDYHGNKD